MQSFSGLFYNYNAFPCRKLEYHEFIAFLQVGSNFIQFSCDYSGLSHSFTIQAQIG